VHALIEFIIGMIALLAAMTLSPFGVDLNTPRAGEREVSRTADCSEIPSRTQIVATPRDC
jgi:hypothetical protein